MATNTVANPSDLAGAAAFLALLQQIERLPIVQVRIDASGEPDDGKRMDYATADRLLDEALNSHGTNCGFRQALSNFLLGELHDGTTNLTRFDAQYLLTDGGFRPKDEVPNDAVPSAAGTTEERLVLAAEASYEIESIVLALRRLDHSTTNWYLMRGLFLRIEALNSVVMSVTGGGDEGREVNEMREVLFGLRWNEQVEVAHG